NVFQQSVEEAGMEEDEQVFFENLSQEEAELFEFIGVYPRTFDEIIKESGFTAQRTNEVLLLLELKGIIEPLPGKSYQRVTSLSLK
ncbi:MAG: hypothetical protein N2B58_09255, partial [Desulfobacterales bacterium]